MSPLPPAATGIAGRLVRLAFALPGQTLLLLIRLYQRTLSPLLPVVSLGACGCRFTPTCSHYAAEAIRRHGAITGLGLALARLVKCTPRHSGGFDPVPPAPSPRRCVRAAPSSSHPLAPLQS